MVTDLENARTEDLVLMYEDAAVEHGHGTVEGVLPLTNRTADTVSAVYCELRRRGPAAQLATLPLLLSDQPAHEVGPGRTR